VCKTDYVLIAKMTDDYGFSTNYLRNEPGRYVDIEFSLYDSHGEP
jgi:hypothetical protein